MLKRRRKEPAGGVGINLTPVLGLAFILVLVFVAAVPFARKRGLDFVEPCWWEGGYCGDGPPALVFAVDSRNRVFFEGDGRYGPKQVDVRSVRSIVARGLIEHPKRPILVQADRESDMGTVIRVVDEAKLARHPSPPVSIATVED